MGELKVYLHYTSKNADATASITIEEHHCCKQNDPIFTHPPPPIFSVLSSNLYEHSNSINFKVDRCFH